MKICVGEEYVSGKTIIYGDIKKLERYTRTGDVEVIQVGDMIHDNSGRKVNSIMCTSDDNIESFITVDENGRVIGQYIGGEFTVYYFGI